MNVGESVVVLAAVMDVNTATLVDAARETAMAVVMEDVAITAIVETAQAIASLASAMDAKEIAVMDAMETAAMVVDNAVEKYAVIAQAVALALVLEDAVVIEITKDSSQTEKFLLILQ